MHSDIVTHQIGVTIHGCADGKTERIYEKGGGLGHAGDRHQRGDGSELRDARAAHALRREPYEPSRPAIWLSDKEKRACGACREQHCAQRDLAQTRPQKR